MLTIRQFFSLCCGTRSNVVAPTKANAPRGTHADRIVAEAPKGLLHHAGDLNMARSQSFCVKSFGSDALQKTQPMENLTRHKVPRNLEHKANHVFNLGAD